MQLVDETHANTTGFGFAAAGSLGSFLGETANAWALWGNYGSDLRVYNNGAATTYPGITLASTDDTDILLNIDAGMAWWRKNGTVISGDPVAGTGAMATFTPGTTIFIAADPYASPASTRLRTDPAEMIRSSVAGYTDGWPV